MHENPREDDDSISLLDLLVVAAEHWLLLLIVPLLAGLAAFGAVSMQSESWRTSAVVSVPRAEVSSRLASTALDEAGLPSRLGTSTQELIDSLSVAQGADASLTGVEVTREDPDAARVTLAALVDHLTGIIEAERITAPRAAMLAEIAALEAGIAMRDDIVASLFSILETTEPDVPLRAQTYAQTAAALNDVMVARDEQRANLVRLQVNLNALPTTLVWETPTEPVRIGGIQPLVAAAGIAIGTGFVLLILIFIIRGLRTAAADPENREKVARLRRAFFLKPAA